jgi:nitric oxide reductase NorD protein
MAESEDVITDAARHATVFARDLWRRRRGRQSGSAALALADVAERIDLLIRAVLGVSYPIRSAQPPARPSLLRRIWGEGTHPRRLEPLPATDGRTLWLPGAVVIEDPVQAMTRYRLHGLRQAVRAHRGSAQYARTSTALRDDLYLVLEAHAADHALIALLPGLAGALAALRRDALAMHTAGAGRRAPDGGPAERLRRAFLAAPEDVSHEAAGFDMPLPATPAQCWNTAVRLAAAAADGGVRYVPLVRDAWSGELRPPPADEAATTLAAYSHTDVDPATARSARLPRRPQARTAAEDDSKQGAWMIQTTQPHERAEDAIGMQRPTDRDATTAAEEFADALSELPQARLVATPGRPKEILLSDDAPPGRARIEPTVAVAVAARYTYPEWDYRSGGYRLPGAVVSLAPPRVGDPRWVERTLREHGTLLRSIQRRFEMLRVERLRLRKQLDGEDIDLAAYVESVADFRAGLPFEQALYQTQRRARRDLAIMLLIDVSGSTDSWIAADKRVIDVEREALLLVCLALDGLAAPYAVLAFSGEGPSGVVARSIKTFDERYSSETAQCIAGLEPERYTRAGAALRHATSLLMRENARHRLLVLLSDGKPNDVDEYDGRYGVEDMRQAVTEARLQGVAAFCLTIDRQAASYLPAVFGARQYALLTKPERLPVVLLDWMRRLVAA